MEPIEGNKSQKEAGSWKETCPANTRGDTAIWNHHSRRPLINITVVNETQVLVAFPHDPNRLRVQRFDTTTEEWFDMGLLTDAAMDTFALVKGAKWRLFYDRTQKILVIIKHFRLNRHIIPDQEYGYLISVYNMVSRDKLSHQHTTSFYIPFSLYSNIDMACEARGIVNWFHKNRYSLRIFAIYLTLVLSLEICMGDLACRLKNSAVYVLRICQRIISLSLVHCIAAKRMSLYLLKELIRGRLKPILYFTNIYLHNRNGSVCHLFICIISVLFVNVYLTTQEKLCI